MKLKNVKTNIKSGAKTVQEHIKIGEGLSK